MTRMMVIGGGFAGLWSAVGAARAAREFHVNEIEITLVSNDPYLTIRSRLYDEDLSRARVPLSKVLEPACVRGVERIPLPGVPRRVGKPEPPGASGLPAPAGSLTLTTR